MDEVETRSGCKTREQDAEGSFVGLSLWSSSLPLPRMASSFVRVVRFRSLNIRNIYSQPNFDLRCYIPNAWRVLVRENSVTRTGRENHIGKTSAIPYAHWFGPHSYELSRTGGGLMGVYVDQ